MTKNQPAARRASSQAKFDKRRAELISIAAACFNEQGYDAASMRDIASRMKILPGTIYYYFPSKESLLVAVHEEGVRRISSRIEAALAKSTDDPWRRLSDASAAYLESMLNTDRDFAVVIIAEFRRHHSKMLRAKLLANRDGVEQHFRNVMADLPLRRGVNRSLLRLGLLGQLAWTFAWYKKGKITPSDIARQMVEQMRRGTEK